MQKNFASQNRPVSGSARLPLLTRRLLPAACLFLVSAGLSKAQPTINSLYPTTLTERAGDHVAYLVSATPSSGTLTYAWYQTGSPSTVLSTSNSLVLTSITPASAGTYYVVVTDNNGPVTSANVTLNVINSPYLTLTNGNLIVARVGEGSQALSAKTGNTLYFDQYTPSGTYENSIQVPDEGTGQSYGAGSTTTYAPVQVSPPALLVEGAGSDAPLEAMTSLSSINQEYLCFAGYCQAYPYSGTGNVNNGGAAYPRGLATINAFGVYSLVYTNEGLDNGGSALIHCMATPDVTNLYTTGEAGSAGVKFVNITDASYANGSGIPTGTGTSGSAFVSDTGGRSIQIINGPLVASGFSSQSNLVYAETGATNLNGLYAAVGVPESPAASSITFKALLYTGSTTGNSAQPLDFAFSPDNRRIYVADARAFAATNSNLSGGIQCWVSNSVGGYSYWYTIQPMTGLTNGAQTLTVDFSANSAWGTNVFGAKIYATTFGAATNSLVSITDNGPSSAPTVLATAGLNEALRGVRFSPAAIPPAIVAGPLNQTNYPGNNATFTVSATGSQPFFYQWSYAGSPIAGATNSSFTTNGISFGSAGTYSVVVSNLTTQTATNSALLTVIYGVPTFALGVQSYTETVGDHLSLVPAVTGQSPLSYQWYEGSTNNPISGQTNASLSFTNVQTTASGTYILVVTNSLGAATNSGTLTVTTGLQPMSATNLIVARIGDGVQPLSGATGNTLYLDQYTTNGAYVNTIQIPDEGTGMPYGTGSSSSSNMPFGSPALLVAGGNVSPGEDAAYEAFLTRSPDGQTIDFGGYCQAYPFSGADVSVSAGGGGTQWRGIGEVNGYGAYSLVYTNTGLYSAGNHQFHSAVTYDQINYWTAGESGSSSIKYVTPGFEPANGIGIPALVGSDAGPRVVQIVNDSVVFSDVGLSPVGIYVAYGLPLSSPPNGAFLLVAESNSPMDFAFSPDGRTVYIADNGTYSNSASQLGGIQRWDTNTVSGGYSFSYTLGTGTGSTAGARGLTADFSAQGSWGTNVFGAKLYATTAESTGNRLIAITDNGSSSSATTLVTATATNILSGVKFAPAVVPISIVSEPQSQAVLAGATNAVFTVGVAGNQPYFYQWETNGEPIADATNSSLSVDASQYPLSGYTVVVSNLFSAVTSAPPASISFVPYISFNTNGSGWSVNGTLGSGLPMYLTNALTSNLVEMTAGTYDTSTSTFFNDPVYVGGFLATWTYQVVNPTTNNADGLCFVLQNDARGPAALGGSGGNLGYSSISNSVAMEFHIYSNSLGGVGYTFNTNGVLSTNQSTSPVVLTNGNPINVALKYLNGVASLTLVDTVTSNTFTASSNINIVSLVGTNTAYIGFTGADGGTASTQTVSNFVYVPLIGLTYAASGGAIALSWPANVGGYMLQQNSGVNNPGQWSTATNPVSVVGDSNQTTVTISNRNLFYRLAVP